jgi:hypothetical protein
LCCLCVFVVLALIGVDGDGMGSVMVVECFECPVNGPCMPCQWHDWVHSP